MKANGQEYSPEQKEVWKMEEVSWELLKQRDLEKYLTLWDKDAEVWADARDGPKPKRFYVAAMSEKDSFRSLLKAVKGKMRVPTSRRLQVSVSTIMLPLFLTVAPLSAPFLLWPEFYKCGRSRKENGSSLAG
jgi:hypothetical protein